jgi:cyclophilin family peptidyl-prolyl cis-trans isomerase
MQIDESTIYQVTLETDRGPILLELDPQLAPVSVNHFVVNARNGFYDGLTFHRVVPGFVIQGGDPEGTGSGGPGYEWTGGRPESSDVYTAGSVSMANSGSDPSTNGSQFFVALDDISDRLAADFTYFGDVTEGFEVAEAIGALGEGDGPPTRPVTIETITITQS